MSVTKKNVTGLVSKGTVLLNQREVPYAQYKAKDGDTIYSIWQRHRSRTTVGAIKTANKLTTNVVKSGKSIKIPLVL
ncbi:LysM peptidoglycan-binding domain-containing protein [Levilactobacillus tangyuanensis]|uniref:LysM peptidoglycan-binding domain-containing protein n=1 Tax=Levilactobacillus tangyuanensis TaxID=2486021 RepID=A0ABW1TQ30_9LACO|nr:LysM peptidoglycan-binding domain-containing protein [Levilactobacillus tangyuanensis]